MKNRKQSKPEVVAVEITYQRFDSRREFENASQMLARYCDDLAYEIGNNTNNRSIEFCGSGDSLDTLLESLPTCGFVVDNVKHRNPALAAA